MDGSILNMIAGFIPAGPPPALHTNMRPATSASATHSRSACTRRKNDHQVVHMICFSKDRAFQLDQLLLSATRHLLLSGPSKEGDVGGDEETEKSSKIARGFELHVSVLYRVSPTSRGSPVLTTAATAQKYPPEPCSKVDSNSNNSRSSGSRSNRRNNDQERSPGPKHTMQESYDLVQKRHPCVSFVREKPGQFCDQLCELVQHVPRRDVLDHEIEEEHNINEQEETCGRYVLFAVDDMFFYNDCSLPHATRLLEVDPSVFCVHLRLHPGITWSHTSDSPCKIPPFSPTEKRVSPEMSGDNRSDGNNINVEGCFGGCEDAKSKLSSRVTAQRGQRDRPGSESPRRLSCAIAADLDLLTFSRDEGSGEWNYPWDLTGGLYRREDALAVVLAMVDAYGKEAAANPNLLEYNGHRLLLQLSERQSPRLKESCARNSDVGSADRTAHDFLPVSSPDSPSEAGGACRQLSKPNSSATAAADKLARIGRRCACSGRALVSSLAVNRVQSTYTTPVYGTAQGDVRNLDNKLWSLERGRHQKDHVENVRLRRDSRVDGGNVGDEVLTFSRVQAGETGEESRREGGLDGRAYRRHTYNSVHVGELWFESNDLVRENERETLEERRNQMSGQEATSIDRRDDNGLCRGDAGHVSAVAPDLDESRQKYDDLSPNQELSGEAETAASILREDRRDASPNTLNTTSTPKVAENVRELSKSLTVLLPVRNGGEHLLDAIESVVACAQEMPLDGQVELLIIDDGSEDGAVEKAVAAITASTVATAGDADPQEATGSDREAVLTGTSTVNTSASPSRVTTVYHSNVCQQREKACSTTVAVSVRVIRHKHTMGLAFTLNEGLREARSELVARMDADDVCMPGRFKREVAFMLNNPHVWALGSSVAIFSGECIRISSGKTTPREADVPPVETPAYGRVAQVQRPQEMQQHQQQRQEQYGQQQYLHRQNQEYGREERRTASPMHLPASGVHRIERHPTDSAFLAWSLLFGCCLAHPSMILRRDRVIAAGGYDAAAEPAEDYDLWLRLDAISPCCLANTGEVLLGLRKHSGNVSRARRQEQSEAAFKAAERAMSRLLQGCGRAKGGGAGPAGAEKEGCRGEGIPSPVPVSLLRSPEMATSVEDLAEAAQLLGRLEAAMLERLGCAKKSTNTSGVAEEDGIVCDGERREETGEVTKTNSRRSEEAPGSGEGQAEVDDQLARALKLIERDAEARLAAIAMHAMRSFGAWAAPVLDEWRRRYPDRPLLGALAGGR